MLDYYDMLDKINNLINNSRVTVTKNIKARQKQLSILKKIFKGTNFDELDIIDMSVIDADSYTIVRYETENISQEYLINNIAILSGDKPIFKMENSSKKYCIEEAYTLYEENSKIKNRIRKRTVSLDDIRISDIVILNEQESPIREYSRHNYKLYYKENEVVAFINHDKMWIKGEQSFEQRLAIINKNISNVTDLIEDKVNGVTTGNDVKIYKIKRKTK